MPPNVSVKLLIVDDHPLFRQGVRFALASYDDITVVFEAPNGVLLVRHVPPASIIGVHGATRAGRAAAAEAAAAFRL